MDVIDEQGRLFGTVNVIDALVVLVVLSTVVAGAALVVGQESPAEPREITIAAQTPPVQPYVAAAIPEGSVDGSSVVAVHNKSIRPTTVAVRADNGTLHERDHPLNRTVTMAVTLSVSEVPDDGVTAYRFNDEPLEIGRDVTFDFGRVSVNGTVTSFASESG